MAGQPFMRRFEQRIEEEGGDDVIFDRIAAGETLSSIVKSYDVSVSTLYRWIYGGKTKQDPNKPPSPRALAYKEAKAMSAEPLADEAGEILDNAKPVTSADATIVKARAEHRRWLAGIRDREQFGDAQPQVAVNVSLGDLHLQALVAKGRAQIEEAEFEEIDDSAALPGPEAED